MIKICQDEGCKMTRLQGGWFVIKIKINSLAVEGYYCNFCQMFQAVENENDIDWNNKNTLAQFLAKNDGKPCTSYDLMTCIDEEYNDLFVTPKIKRFTRKLP